MSIPVQDTPPESRTSYILPQLAGEKLTIAGWKGVFRILASSKQTNGGMAVMTGGAAMSEAPGFHYHNEAHDVFIVLKGHLKLWCGDQCRILAPGDFAYAPPKTIHNPQWLGPHTESLCFVAPGDWVDFFRYIGTEYKGFLIPEEVNDDKENLIKGMIAAKERFDVQYVFDYQPPEVSDWLPTENKLGGPLEPYFLKANTGPRWLAGGLLSRPYILAGQNGGRFAMSSIESSKVYTSSIFESYIKFAEVDHCLFVVEGKLKVEIEGSAGENEVNDSETVVISAGQGFKLRAASPFLRFISVTNGQGIETLIQDAGRSFERFVLPERGDVVDHKKVASIAKEVGATVV